VIDFSNLIIKFFLRLLNMISLQQLRRFFATVSLSVVLATTVAFGFGAANSLAAPLSLSSISESHGQLIALWGSGTAKDLEGKGQELVGNVTGDPKDQIGSTSSADRRKGILERELTKRSDR
jgi:hypothetical protein